MIKAGGSIGILGGGQLGRMLAVSAAQLGLRTVVYAPEKDSVAAQVANEFICAPYEDAAALNAFAQKCDVITWEFENVPVGPLGPIAAKLAMPPRALEIAQDRLSEKEFVRDLGGKTAPFAALRVQDDLDRTAAEVGTPAIVKTRRDGYDGKGQWRLESAHDIPGLSLEPGAYIYEGFVNFVAEYSVILARSKDGDIRYYDSPHNVHEGGILRRSALPAHPIIASQVNAARQMARKIADTLSYVGVLTCEFFATHDGPVFNEMAPRVHNSGHWTIEGAATSQFENHIRAICGLPLGSTALTADKMEMRNIIGEEAHDAGEYLEEADAHLHLYGKAPALPGRKMGHVTLLHRQA